VVFDKFWVLEAAKQNLLLNIVKKSNNGFLILDSHGCLFYNCILITQSVLLNWITLGLRETDNINQTTLLFAESKIQNRL
jgi:hypothetical protein